MEGFVSFLSWLATVLTSIFAAALGIAVAYYVGWKIAIGGLKKLAQMADLDQITPEAARPKIIGYIVLAFGAVSVAAIAGFFVANYAAVQRFYNSIGLEILNRVS